MNFTNPHFAEPDWLWLAVLGPLALVLLQVHAARMRRRQLAQFAAADRVAELTRSHSPMRRRFKNALLALAVAGFGVALARPQWGEQTTETVQLLGQDVVFILDCSRSMLAADVSPNRLERAKLALRDCVQRGGFGRVGLVAFAGQAFLQCPPTLDYGAFDEAVAAVDQHTITTQGSDIGRALDEGRLAYGKTEGRKLLVLLSDGEDTDARAASTAEQLAMEGVVVFTVGVGTAAGAELHFTNAQGQHEPVRNADGQIHRSRLDEPALRAIAQATGGGYFPLGALGEGLVRVRQAVEKLDAPAGTVAAQTFGVDRYHWFVAAVLLLLVGESLISTRRRTLNL